VIIKSLVPLRLVKFRQLTFGQLISPASGIAHDFPDSHYTPKNTPNHPLPYEHTYQHMPEKGEKGQVVQLKLH